MELVEMNYKEILKCKKKGKQNINILRRVVGPEIECDEISASTSPEINH